MHYYLDQKYFLWYSFCVVKNKVERNRAMSENEIKIEEAEEQVEEEAPVHEPKQNYVFYTIVSVLLFFALYFGYRFAVGKLFRDYTMKVDGSAFSAEQLENIKEFAKIDSDSISDVRLERVNNKSTVFITYKDIGDPEEFAENVIMYEYGNIAEDIRTEIYPHGDRTVEYVFADSYVNIDDPTVYCMIYDYNGETYAQFRSENITSEISALFMGAEKIYKE